MAVVIVGPGAIGCLFASFLARAGETVALLGKHSAQARHIEQQGVRVDTENGARTVAVQATTDPACVANADYVLLCVKAYDMHIALSRVAPWFHADRSVAVSLQNGVDSLDALARMAGPARTVCAATAQGAVALGAGHVRHAGAGPTWVAPCAGAPPNAAQAFAGLLRQSGVPCRYDADANSVLWSKLILNAGINPVTALENVSNGELLQRPALFRQALLAAAEARQVARAQGVALRDMDIEFELRQLCARTARNDSSMLQDLRHGRRTEIDAINGAVLREAAPLGIAVPVNAKLVEAIRQRES